MDLKYLLVAGVLVCQISAAEETVVNPITEDGIVKIEWQNPKKFRDIKTSNELQSRFENRLFETLTKNINKQAEKVLKPGQKLEMQVSDVDLAGDMRPTFGATSGDIRIVKDLYPPRVIFTYKITQGEKVVIAGDVTLRDMSFMSNSQGFNEKPFHYESNLFNDWLQKSIAPKL